MSVTYAIEITRDAGGDERKSEVIDMHMKIPESTEEEVHGETHDEANIEWLHASERNRVGFLVAVQKQRDPSVEFVRFYATRSSDGAEVYSSDSYEPVRMPEVSVADDDTRAAELADADS